jgi:hypothetical protein
MDFDIGQLASEIDAGTFDASGQTDIQQTIPQQAQPTIDLKAEYEYQARGKAIKEPLETIFKRASMGYDYAQLVQGHKQRESELAAREQAIKDSETRWKAYDEYAHQNPQWADFVKSSWESRFTQSQQQAGAQQQGWQPRFENDQQTGTPQANIPPEIAQKLGTIDAFINQYQAEKQAAAQAEADSALNTAIENTQKKFPDFDLRATDPTTGESLEMQVLRHAQLQGINSFEAAFKDLYFDKIVEKSAFKAKETAAKALSQNVRKGFLGQSAEPMIRTDASNTSVRGRSYHEMMDIAAKELGIG